jgi:hypothetical protein
MAKKKKAAEPRVSKYEDKLSIGGNIRGCIQGHKKEQGRENREKQEEIYLYLN